MTRNLLMAVACAALLMGCKQYAYFQSPFQGITSPYKTMPLQSDNVTADTYAGGGLFWGGANHRSNDGLYGFTGSLYRGHSFGNFSGFYGLTGTMGGYRINKISSREALDPDETKYPNDSLINARSGRKFFGGLGATAGLYYTIPFDNGGEWRALGIEANWQHEFGQYLSFRRDLPDTAANLNSRPGNFLTLGIHSDFEFKTRRGSGGIKFGAVFNTRSEKQYSIDGIPAKILPGYWSTTYHLTRNRTTGFLQCNLGTYHVSLMLGVNYRL